MRGEFQHQAIRRPAFNKYLKLAYNFSAKKIARLTVSFSPQEFQSWDTFLAKTESWISVYQFQPTF